MAQIQTQAVTLKDGSSVVINAADFDPSLHTLGKPKPKAAKKKVKAKGRAKLWPQFYQNAQPSCKVSI